MAHSIFSASASSRWLNCPGSLAMAKGIESKAGAAAFLGTAGHELADQCLKNDTDPETFDSVTFKDGGKTHVVELDQDFVNGIQKYVDYIRGITGLRFPEMRVCYGTPWLQIPNKMAFGTSDAIVYDEEDKELDVVDLKTGRVYVSSEENTQMLLYAAGAITTLEWMGYGVKKVNMTIVQPFVSGQPSTWTLTRSVFNSKLKELKEKAQKAKRALRFEKDVKGDKVFQKTYLSPGEDQCRWCPALTFCPAVKQAVDRVVEAAQDEEFEVMVKKLSPDELGARLNEIPLVAIYIKAVEAEAFDRLSAGEPVTGKKLVVGRQGARAWMPSSEEVIEKLTEGGLPEETFLNPPSLRTPTQVDTAVKRDNEAKDLVSSLVTRSPGKPTLADEDDPRETWTGNMTDDEFEVIS